MGGNLARRLEQRPEIDAIFGIDIADPALVLERTDFVHADTRHSTLTKLVRGLEVDTVVHAAVLTDSTAAPRVVHETNVIGTMNLLAACAGAGSPVRKLVVKSGAGVYGAHPDGPSFIRESMAGQRPARTGLERDLLEMEQLVHDFAIRNAAVSVTTLRLGPRLGRRAPTPLSNAFRPSAVLRFAGYDPRLQLISEDDAVEALYRATVADHRGVFNVCGEGVLLLTQAIGLACRRDLPVLVLGGPIGRLALRAITGADLPEYGLDLLRFGLVLDCSALKAEFGWRPARSTREVMMEYVSWMGSQHEETPQPQEYELNAYLRRRRLGGR